MPRVKITKWGWKCNHCGYEWFQRGKEKPAVCPRCGSARWDRPIKKKKGDEKKNEKKE